MAFPKGDKRTGVIAKRPHQGVAVDHEQIRILIKKYAGNVSKVADAIGCTRGTVSYQIKHSEDLSKALADARERWIDEVEESVLQRAADSNDSTLQIFVLKTQAKNRGWEQNEAQNTAKDIATAAFDYILNKSKNPAEYGVNMNEQQKPLSP